MLAPAHSVQPAQTKIICGDALGTLKQLHDNSVHCVVTSPPYFGLRDYGVAGQVGLEQSPAEYVAKLVEIFREVRRVLRPDGTLWLNLGDSYANDAKWGGSTSGKHAAGIHGETGIGRGKKETGLKAKDLIGIPWRVAFALQADGWYLRQDIIWHKPNPMPESVRDRCTKAHEYLFMLTKSPKYYFDCDAISEDAAHAGKRVTLGAKSFSKGQAAGNNVKPSGNALKEHYDVPEKKNRRSVWVITPKPYKEAHFATFPPDLPELCIKAGCPEGGIVMDIFGGSGTTGLVAKSLNRHCVLIELNPEYVKLIEKRLDKK